MPLLSSNISQKGRLIRALCALATGVSSLLLWRESRPLAIGLGASSAFLAFEAARGWCALRACGVKTKF